MELQTKGLKRPKKKLQAKGLQELNGASDNGLVGTERSCRPKVCWIQNGALDNGLEETKMSCRHGACRN